MWTLSSYNPEGFIDFFEKDFSYLYEFISAGRYSISVDHVRSLDGNRFRIVKIVGQKPHTYQLIKQTIAEFDNKEELVAMVRLIMASEEH